MLLFKNEGGASYLSTWLFTTLRSDDYWAQLSSITQNLESSDPTNLQQDGQRKPQELQGLATLL